MTEDTSNIGMKVDTIGLNRPTKGERVIREERLGEFLRKHGLIPETESSLTPDDVVELIRELDTFSIERLPDEEADDGVVASPHYHSYWELYFHREGEVTKAGYLLLLDERLAVFTDPRGYGMSTTLARIENLTREFQEFHAVSPSESLWSFLMSYCSSFVDVNPQQGSE